MQVHILNWLAELTIHHRVCFQHQNYFVFRCHYTKQCSAAAGQIQRPTWHLCDEKTPKGSAVSMKRREVMPNCLCDTSPWFFFSLISPTETSWAFVTSWLCFAMSLLVISGGKSNKMSRRKVTNESAWLRLGGQHTSRAASLILWIHSESNVFYPIWTFHVVDWFTVTLPFKEGPLNLLTVHLLSLCLWDVLYNTWLFSQGGNRTTEKISKPYSPLYCPPVCTASSCVPCHWTSASRTSTNQSYHSDPVWRQPWSWFARPSRPPATDTCPRREATSLRLLQRDTNTYKWSTWLDEMNYVLVRRKGNELQCLTFHCKLKITLLTYETPNNENWLNHRTHQ